MVVPSISNPFYAPIAEGIEDVAYENGYNVFLINTAANLNREAAAMDSLWSQHINGAILCSLRLPLYKLLESIQRFPAVVLFNRELRHPIPNMVTISVNDQRAAQEAVGHFIKQGRRHIAYIGAPKNSLSSGRRLEGYRAALKNADIAFDPALVAHILPDTNTGKEAAEVLLACHPGIDAILAFNDLVAVGVLQACKAAGKKVPDDVAIIGADDIPLASLMDPPLTTSRVNLNNIGRLSMQTLLDIFAGKVTSAAYIIEPELILRESG
jgi:DNA-binding LacI/PurR family transcriptional regulator